MTRRCLSRCYRFLAGAALIVLFAGPSCNSNENDGPRIDSASGYCETGRQLHQLLVGLPEIATSSADRQRAAEASWSDLLRTISVELPNAEARRSAELLRRSPVLVTDRPWHEPERAAYGILAKELRNCDLELPNLDN